MPDNNESLDGRPVRSLSELVRVLAHCSAREADSIADRICEDPEAVALLARACEFSLNVVAEGQVWVVAGHHFKIPVFTATGNLLQARGVLGARRFCRALRDAPQEAIITEAVKNHLR